MNIYDYIKETYGDIKYLSEGSYRAAYSFANDNFVIKIPLDNSGNKQSISEYNIYNSIPSHLKYLLAPIISYDCDFNGIPLIVMPRVTVLTDLFPEFYFNSAMIKYGSMGFINDLTEFILKCRQSDLVGNSDNWGVLKDKLVCIDYGLIADLQLNLQYDLDWLNRLSQQFTKTA